MCKSFRLRCLNPSCSRPAGPIYLLAWCSEALNSLVVADTSIIPPSLYNTSGGWGTPGSLRRRAPEESGPGYSSTALAAFASASRGRARQASSNAGQSGNSQPGSSRSHAAQPNNNPGQSLVVHPGSNPSPNQTEINTLLGRVLLAAACAAWAAEARDNSRTYIATLLDHRCPPMHFLNHLPNIANPAAFRHRFNCSSLHSRVKVRNTYGFPPCVCMQCRREDADREMPWWPWGDEEVVYVLGEAWGERVGRERVGSGRVDRVGRAGADLVSWTRVGGEDVLVGIRDWEAEQRRRGQ